MVLPDKSSEGAPGARVLILDIHGEYTSALKDIARIFTINPQPGDEALFVPYWALEAGELLEFLFGSVSEAQETTITTRFRR